MYDITSLIILYTLGVIVMMAIPMVPVWMAIMEKKDINPLYVKLDYAKDPRAIAKEFESLFFKEYPKEKLHAGSHLTSERFGQLSIIETDFNKKKFTELVYVLKNTTIPVKTFFAQELVARSGLTLADRCHAKAIYAMGDLSLGRSCCISRWIDTKGKLRIDENTQINIASASDTIHLAKHTSFNRLYGQPIMTSDTFEFNHNISDLWQTHEVAAQIDKNLLYIRKDKHYIKEGETIFQSIVLWGELYMHEHAKIFGDIKANGDVVLERGCVVDGNIICEGNIVIHEECFVTGNLFSRKDIIIHSGSQIGTPEHTKSVIAKGEITLHRSVAIFNYLLTDTKGSTV